LKKLIDAARYAPSARNIQPWEFVVVTDGKKLKKIAEITDYGKFIADAAACVVVLCDSNEKYFLEDGCNASMNILLAAKNYGIGSCWVAGHKKEYVGKIKKLLGVPEKYEVISLLALGYPAENPKPKKRSLNDVLHWEKF